MKKKVTILTAMGMLAFVAFFNAHATIWRVNNQPIFLGGDDICDHCFTDLQLALSNNNVLPGDTIHLEASAINYGDIVISKKIVLLGPGYFLNENSGLQNNLNTATVNNLTIEKGGAETIVSGISVASVINIRDNGVKITRCYVLYDIRLNPASTISDIAITQCYVGRYINDNAIGVNNILVSNCYAGTYIDFNSSPSHTGLVIHNVTNQLHIKAGITAYNNIIQSIPEKHNNDSTNIYKNIITGTIPDWLTGSSNMSEVSATIFPATGTKDGILKPNPPNVCAKCYMGQGGAEIGMFGGNNPYHLSGIPGIPTIYKLRAKSNSVSQGDTIHTEVSTRSNN